MTAMSGAHFQKAAKGVRPRQNVAGGRTTDLDILCYREEVARRRPLAAEAARLHRQHLREVSQRLDREQAERSKGGRPRRGAGIWVSRKARPKKPPQPK